MKKSSSIILTLLLSLSISLCSAQNIQEDTECPADSICRNIDTMYCDCQLPEVTYNYYFRSRFCDRVFRFCFPHYYHRLVYGPGHRCNPPLYLKVHRPFFHHETTGLANSTFAHNSSSAKRGGFGYHGTRATQSN